MSQEKFPTYGRQYIAAPYGRQVEIGLETYPDRMAWVEGRAAEIEAELATEGTGGGMGHINHLPGGPVEYAMYGRKVDGQWIGAPVGLGEIIPADPPPPVKVWSGVRPALRPYTVPRDWIAPADLLSRCTAASRLTLAGKQWSTEDRLECTGDILLSTLERHPCTSGYVAPVAGQMARLCNLASNWMQARNAQVARDAKDAATRASATSFTPHVAVESDATLGTPMGCAKVAIDAIQNLGLDAKVWPLAYGAARAAVGTEARQVAEELGLTYVAYRQAVSRARKYVPSAHGYADLIAHLETACTASDDSLPWDQASKPMNVGQEPDWPARSAARYRGAPVECTRDATIKRDGRRTYDRPGWANDLPPATARRLATGASMKRAREAARTSEDRATRRLAAGLPATVR